MATFRAIQVTEVDGRPTAQVTAQLTALAEQALDAGDVTVQGDHATVNHKDGLAITGTGGLIQLGRSGGAAVRGAVRRLRHDPRLRAWRWPGAHLTAADVLPAPPSRPTRRLES